MDKMLFVSINLEDLTVDVEMVLSEILSNSATNDLPILSTARKPNVNVTLSHLVQKALPVPKASVAISVPKFHADPMLSVTIKANVSVLQAIPETLRWAANQKVAGMTWTVPQKKSVLLSVMEYGSV